MNSQSLVSLAQNISLLLAAALLFDVLALRWGRGQALLRRVAAGLGLGTIGVVIMSTPWVFTPGVVFDTRSVLVAVSGLFFGAVPTAIAVGLTALYRVQLGGGGALTGVLVLLASGGIGLIWRHRKKGPLAEMGFGELWLFGLLVHLVMLALMLTLPPQVIWQVLADITLPVLLLYPLGTALIGRLLVRGLKREEDALALRTSEERFSSLVDYLAAGVILQDSSGVILTWNRQAAETFGIPAAQALGRKAWDLPLHVFKPDGTPWPAEEHPSVRTLSTGESCQEVLMLVLHPDGGKLWISANTEPIYRTPGPKPSAVAISFADVTARVQAEEALLHSEERYRLIAEHTSDSIWAMNADLQFTYLSPSTERLFGYSNQEMSTLPWDELVEPGHLQAVQDSFAALLATPSGGSIKAETLLRHKGGRKVWVEFSATAVLDEQGRLSGVVGITRDVTERKQAEELLQQNEQRFKFMVEKLLAGAVYVEGDKLLFNAAAEQILGYSVAELSDLDTWFTTLYGPKAAEVRAYYEADKAAGFPAPREVPLVTRNGEERIVEFAAYAEGHQEIWLLYDLTARRKAEAALVERERLYRLLADNVDDVIWVLDLRDRFTYISPSILKLRGITPEEAMLESPAQTMTPASWAAVQDLRRRVREDPTSAPDTPLRMEVEQYHKNGGTVWVEVITRLLRDDSGRPFGVLGVSRDITQMRQAREQLLLAKEAAETANRAKSEFLANMSHELRTPLNGIMGMLQLLQNTPLSNEQGGYALTAIQSCRRLTRLLADILDLSRVEAGKLSLQVEPLDLAAVLGQVRDLFAPMAQQGGVELRCLADSKLPRRVLGDGVRLQQVLANLVGNALKFTALGSVRIEAKLLPHGTAERCRVLFTVEDTGIGIADEMLKTLFEPFTQVSQGYTRHHQGAGLGLAICKRLVRLMGGDIAVDSVPGRGTTVYVSVPFALESHAEPQREAEAPLTGSPRPGLRVLLAEDDPVSVVVAAKMLELEGCTVRVVEDGEQALEALRAAPFDLVLMDVQMPVLDGVAATRAIRAGAAGADRKATPIAAMTAYAMSGDRELFLAAGMDHYLAKPLEVEQLRQVLGQVAGAGKG